MTLTTSPLRTWALLSLGAAVLVAAIGAGAAQAARQYFVQGPSASQIILLPGGNVAFDSEIARLAGFNRRLARGLRPQRSGAQNQA